MGSFAQIENGRESWNGDACVPRHRHDRAYAAVVLSGAYEECGSRGRFRVAAGDVLLHDAFDAHLDRFQRNGAQILNVAIEDGLAGFGIGRVADPDGIAIGAERDPREAAAVLCKQLQPYAQAPADWQDALASDLLGDPDCRLDEWARDHHLAPETVSRGFGKVFGLTPASFRLEVRARRAFALIRETSLPLAAIAAKTGFADQAHMSRAMRALTGAAPGAWRRSNPFKTDRARAA
ncbi:MAG TPA: AraC family transcriptional regulator [Rhizomicrobium sp.]|nr:AraC family transcriptional regulator [Rhizomicrobium sp.]